MPLEKYAKATEIQGYLKGVAEQYGLDSARLFQTTVTEMRWNEGTKRWIVHTSRTDQISARFVISCAGFLSNPKLPKIPGIETFDGHVGHAMFSPKESSTLTARNSPSGSSATTTTGMRKKTTAGGSSLAC
jgi:cation diffusion facilitator CzcD-associated flavoprotein CzcO